MKWCCNAFEIHYQKGGERSIAALVDRDSTNEPEFVLQARAFDVGREEAVHTAVPMTLVTETSMQFCPWCGVSLRKWYRKHVAELMRPGLRIDRGY